MKSSLTTIMAVTMAIGLAVFAQDEPKAPVAPPAPGQKVLTKEQIDALIKQKQDELKKGVAAQTNTTRTIPTRRAPTTPAGAPPAPGAPAVKVGTPALPAIPTAQSPAKPAAPGVPAVTTAPPSPGATPAVAAGQVAGEKAAGVDKLKADQSQIVPAGFLAFQNAPPEQWMEFYEDLVGRTILRANALPATQITLHSQSDLTREEAIQAFEHVLTLNGITAVKIGDKFVELVPSAQALQSGGSFNHTDGKDLPEAAQYVTQIVQLKHVTPSDASEAIKQFARTPGGIVAIDATQTLVIRDYAINVKRMLEILAEIDKEIPVDIELEVIPIRYALVVDISAVLGTLTTAGSINPAGTAGGSTAGRTGSSSTRRTSSGTSASGGGRLGVSTGGFGGNTGGLNSAGGINPQQRTGGTTFNAPGGAAGAVNSFQNNLQRIVQNAAKGSEAPLLGDAKIIPDERSNSLIVFGTKQEREMIKKIVKQLDIVQPQVLIEAVIVEVQLNNGLNTGVSFGQSPKSFSKSFTGFGGNVTTVPFGSSLTNANPLNQLGQGLSYYGLLGNNWELAMNAVANDSRFEVLSRPRIQASHAVEAEIFVGETRPFPTGSVSFGGQATTQIQNQQIGIRLNVLPLINVDGLVVLDIAQTVDQIGTDIQVDQFLKVPSIIARSATSRVAVKDGDTIILGGFITSEKRTTKSGIPGLKDIPGLGRLFSSKNDTLVKTELVVFLRPTVLPTPEVAAVAATHEREKLVDVKRTEENMVRDEAERQKKYEGEARKELEKESRKKK